MTKWDKYVAYNSMYADLCAKFDDAQILTAAYLFLFADKDWNVEGKIWEHMTLKWRKPVNNPSITCRQKEQDADLQRLASRD